jgi:hypothetical protein
MQSIPVVLHTLQQLLLSFQQLLQCLQYPLINLLHACCPRIHCCLVLQLVCYAVHVCSCNASPLPFIFSPDYQLPLCRGQMLFLSRSTSCNRWGLQHLLLRLRQCRNLRRVLGLHHTRNLRRIPRFIRGCEQPVACSLQVELTLTESNHDNSLNDKRRLQETQNTVNAYLLTY